MKRYTITIERGGAQVAKYFVEAWDSKGAIRIAHVAYLVKHKLGDETDMKIRAYTTREIVKGSTLPIIEWLP